MKEYELYSKLKIFRHRVERAALIIRAALAQSVNPYVACSFGKDSICLLHLVASELPGVNVLWVRTDEYDEWPGTEDVARAFAERFSIMLHEIYAMPVTECYRKTGGFYVFAVTDEQKKADAEYSASFMQAITDKSAQLGCDLAFIGLRQDESRSRRILLRSRGNLFYAKTHRIIECFPLSGWSGKDVWAYIAKYDLPYLDLYDLAEDRERARNGAMFAANVPVYAGGLHYNGQLAALKQMYPELFNRFAAEFPEVRSYV